jgi:hypothetical protein
VLNVPARQKSLVVVPESPEEAAPRLDNNGDHMFRSLLRVSAAAALAILVSPLTPSAAPAPGLAYDEIVHVVVGATPPPPGNFQNDVSAINSQAANAATPSPAPRKRLGFGQIAGAVLGGGGVGNIGGAVAGDAVSNAAGNALQNSLGGQFAALGASMRAFLQPHLMRYAYYNGWERVDDVTQQTATIRKCDIGQVYTLDLVKKTYSVYDPNSEPAPSVPVPPQQRGSRAPSGTPAAQPPGTAIADISTSTKALGPLRIEGQPTTGYAETAAFATTQSTGSCRDTSASLTTQQYLSALNRPAVTSCPVRRAPVPESANEAVTPPQPTGGCRPTLTFHRSGPPVPAGKLSLYTLVTMNAGATPAPAPATTAGPTSIGFLTERGNLKTLTANDVALFSVPGDFTKAP